ncbi:hypothetical protein JX580_03110 [Thiomicrospira microaerophila]|uniref:hypothetical protein n=1 Tax=Thiomicrospira microaerophila TaxID=406020 RepID=UPI00200E4B02|nr:hypothetical protein [Thiomicrospira microaerophila]UQB42897.1 hypothetical protein JX580_03110 [Thiomicrospira microaerophila]
MILEKTELEEYPRHFYAGTDEILPDGSRLLNKPVSPYFSSKEEVLDWIQTYTGDLEIYGFEVMTIR